MSTESIGFEEAEKLWTAVRPSGHDLYFQGLLSEKLGSEQMLEEDVALLVAEDPEFLVLVQTYAADPHTRALVEATWRRLCPTTEAQAQSDPTQGKEWRARALWATAMDDPRFDLVWKRALDEAKEPPPAMRGSWLAALLALMKKIGGAKGAESSSLMPVIGWLLLGGTAGVLTQKVASDQSNNRGSNQQDRNAKVLVNVSSLHGPVEKLAAAVNASASALNTYQPLFVQLNTALTNQTTQLVTLSDEMKALSTTIAKQQPEGPNIATATQIANLQTTVNNSLKTWQTTLEQTNQSLHLLQQDEHNNGNILWSTLDKLNEIDDGVGVQKGRASQVSSLLEISNKSLKSIQESSGAIQISTADAQKAIETNASTSPLKKDQTEIVEVNDCMIGFTPVLIGADSAQVIFSVMACQGRAASQGSMTVTRDRKLVPGTNIEVAVESVDNFRVWPLPRTASFIHQTVKLDLHAMP